MHIETMSIDFFWLHSFFLLFYVVRIPQFLRESSICAHVICLGKQKNLAILRFSYFPSNVAGEIQERVHNKKTDREMLAKTCMGLDTNLLLFRYMPANAW